MRLRCSVPESLHTTHSETVLQSQGTSLPFSEWEDSDTWQSNSQPRWDSKQLRFSRGTDKKELSLKLGAHFYIDSSAQDVGEELKKLGGAAVVMVTAPTPNCVDPLVPGLRSRGEIIIVSVIEQPVRITTNNMLGKRAKVKVWASGDSRDSEDTMKFAKLMGIRAMSEVLPLEKAQEAYEKMLSNKARFRMVLKIRD